MGWRWGQQGMATDVISLAVEMTSTCSAQFCVSNSFVDRTNNSVIFYGVTGRDVRNSAAVTAAAAEKHSNYSCVLTFRHRASCVIGQAFRYSPENAFYVFNQQIYFII